MPSEPVAATHLFPCVSPCELCLPRELCEQACEAESPQEALKKGRCSEQHKELWAVSEPHQGNLVLPHLCQRNSWFFLPLAQLVFVISEKCHWISQYEGLAQIMGNGVNYRGRGAGASLQRAPDFPWAFLPGNKPSLIWQAPW